VHGDLADLARPDPGAAGPTRPATWLTALDGCDAVLHSAARMEFWGPDAGFERDNLRPSVALFNAAAAAGVKRFVLISAAAVSTDGRRGPAIVDEATPARRPITAYGRVKLSAEQALANADSPGTTLVILRPPLIWGAGMTSVEEMAALAAAGRFAWIDQGRHVMDFVHVDNLAAAAATALDRGRDRGIYYITDGTPTPIRDFFTPLLATQGVDVSRARSVPSGIAAPTARVLDRTARLLRRRAAPPLTNWLIAFLGHDRSYDISSARADLGYRPGVSLAAGLDEMRTFHGASAIER